MHTITNKLTILHTLSFHCISIVLGHLVIEQLIYLRVTAIVLAVEFLCSDVHLSHQITLSTHDCIVVFSLDKCDVCSA